eukprot:1749270-Prymnesium_polylepis.1
MNVESTAWIAPVRGWPIRCVLDWCGCDWIDPPGRSIQRPSGSISGGWIDPRPVGLIQGRTFRATGRRPYGTRLSTLRPGGPER